MFILNWGSKLPRTKLSRQNFQTKMRKNLPTCESRSNSTHALQAAELYLQNFGHDRTILQIDQDMPCGVNSVLHKCACFKPRDRCGGHEQAHRRSGPDPTFGLATPMQILMLVITCGDFR